MLRGWFRTLGALAVLSLPVAALAQAPTEPDGDKKAALEWANKAQDRFEAGDYQGTIDALKEAQKHARPPTFTRLLAQSHEKLGHLLTAQALYQSVLDMPLPAKPQPSWIEAQKGAKTDLAALLPKIPKLTITVTGQPLSTLTISLDDAPFAAEKLGAPILVDPGKHRISVLAPGRERVTREVTSKPGVSDEVTLDMTPPPALTPTVRPSATATAKAPVSTARPVASSAPVATSEPPGPPSPLLSVGRYLSFGLAGAGLIAGGVTGGIVLSQMGEIQKRCNLEAGFCATKAQPGVEQIGLLADISTASFVVAGVFAATGVVLLVIPSKKPQKVGVALGPSFAFVEGSF